MVCIFYKTLGLSTEANFTDVFPVLTDCLDLLEGDDGEAPETQSGPQIGSSSLGANIR